MIIFLFGKQNNFLKVALSSYEANVTFYSISDALKSMRVHASLDLRSELIQGRVKGNARKLWTILICRGHLSLSVVV